MANSIKKSVATAFCDLLDAVKNGENVILLRSSNPFIIPCIDDYDEAVASDGTAAYAAFVSKLAEKMHQSPKKGVHEIDIPQQDKLVTAATILDTIMETKAATKLLHSGNKGKVRPLAK